ncbi:CobW/HypB/UreG family nucleotide-binding protein [Kineothrix alysoides]|uniref:CobW/HypB/UreG family nucleotide-binding protein n=1 Tax=Kineothrix alysoides TaxID=1469948 RepID=A0A4R1QTX9_9FIRM|nr:GTP-binding protein [Kineothrix alysoides]TCL55955.1 CobW/HypB/UreG family nucleotide-binding protein [Kineothrix alysoides]
MTKIDIISGFLGAGKTTLIKKLLKEALADTKVVLIENEFGEIGIDGGFLKEAGIEIKEMNSGCICCSLVGDFGTSLKEVLTTYSPERILIEPSGVGKLSDVMKAVQDVTDESEITLNSAVAVVDASKCKMYIKNFGEFFVNQIENAGTIVLSRTGKISAEKLETAVSMIREYNEKAIIVTTPWEELDGKAILETIEGAKDLEAELMEEVGKAHEHHHEHGEDCTCGCHGHHHDHECDGEHHHGHDHDGEHHHDHECDGEHHHGHDHDGEHHDDHGHEEDHHHHDHDGECHHHEHDYDGEHHHHEHDHDQEHHHHDDHHEHAGHHHADEVFTSWGMETASTYTVEDIDALLKELENEEEYGIVLRAKGMVPAGDGTWVYFDYVPEERDIRAGRPDVTGKICVIGAQLKEEKLKKLFHK